MRDVDEAALHDYYTTTTTRRGVSGTGSASRFDRNGKQTFWPAAVLDERNRAAIWTLCEQLDAINTT